MRLVFAGTPAVAVPTLQNLAASGHRIELVVTRRDAPIGRRRELTASPVADAAERLGLPVLKTDRLDQAATERIVDVEPDLGVIVAYGALVREPLLSAPPHGWINLHFSLLPRWRGAAPVQHALIAGDTVTGASVFRLVSELDAGDVFVMREHPVPPEATAGQVLEDLARLGAPLVHEVVDAIAAGTAAAKPQVGEPTVAPKLDARDGRLDWHAPVARVLDRIRGTTPEPGAWTTVAGVRLKVLAARVAGGGATPREPGAFALDDGAVVVGAADGALVLETVQPAGKAPMRAADWWRGLRTAPVAER